MKKCVAATGLLALVAGLNAQTIPRMKLTDGELSCAQIHAEIGQMDDVLALNAASPMGQQARARKEFLTGFFVQRGCRTSDLGAAPAQAKPASPALAAAPVAPAAAPPSAPDWRALLQGPLPVIDGGAQVVKGSADLKGKRIAIQAPGGIDQYLLGLGVQRAINPNVSIAPAINTLRAAQAVLVPGSEFRPIQDADRLSVLSAHASYGGRARPTKTHPT